MKAIENFIRRPVATIMLNAAILVFGILGLLVCVIFGIVAWVMGNTDLRDMEYGQMDRTRSNFYNASSKRHRSLHGSSTRISSASLIMV